MIDTSNGPSGSDGHSRPPDVTTGEPAIARRAAAALLPTYSRQPVEFVGGNGAWLVDRDERDYLDFLSGIAVTTLGHAHPAVTAAVHEQAATLVHTSNLFYTERQVELAERLAATLGWEDAKTFFCNSGAEANEAALKVARRHGKLQHPDKVGVVALRGGFHGRTLATLALTGNPDKHAPFEPLGEWVTHVPHDDPAQLEAAVGADTCAVWVEVVQGEGGVRAVPDAVLEAARAACDREGALLVVDEVQTGLGRLGAWYGWQQTPVTPDVVCLAKALANGLPIGAAVARGDAAQALGPGHHATTFGGGPVVCAAALAVLGVIDGDGLVDHARVCGALLAERLHGLVGTAPMAAGVRGRGLLQALVLDRPAADAVTAAALRHGLVVNAVAPDAVRLAPPLIVDEVLVDEGVERLVEALGSADRHLSGEAVQQR